MGEEHQGRRVAERLLRKAPDDLDVDEADARASVGDRLADGVAAIGGSWGFIGGFAAVMLGWMPLNTDVPSRWGLALDPYPYVFLNLMLSTLAAIQAPIIMMIARLEALEAKIDALGVRPG